MIVQDFLRNGGSIQMLQDKYAITAKRHGKYPNLVLLKYNMIDSPMAEPIVQECRGLILDEQDNWNIVCYTYKKFFNQGEGFAADIDWNTARFQEKRDGSLMQVFHYEGEWHVSTSGTPDASGKVGPIDITFKDLFWRTWKEMGLNLPISTDCCFAFELTSPFNRVVVPYSESSLTLIGVRNLTTLQEYPVSEWSHVYPVVREFPLGNLTDALASLEHMNPMEQEGYVVVDAKFSRIKAKAPAYLAIHHLIDGMSSKKLLDLIRIGEMPEVLAYYPGWTAEFNKVKVQFDALVVQTETDYSSIKDMPKGGPAEQKAFALEALKYPGKAAMFALRAGKVPSVRQYYADMNINSLLDQLKIKNVEVQE